MAKSSASPQKSTTTNEIGADGWLTLLLSTVVIALVGGLSLLWVGRRVLHHARKTASICNADIELILIPGVRLSTGQPNHDFRLRLKRARLLYQQYGSQLLLMGGITGNEKLSEASAGKLFLVDQGIPPAELLLEDSSRNTLENMHNARKQLRANNIERYVMVSNRYHLARCQALANGLGMYPMLCAAEDNFSAAPSTWPRLLLEAYYLHWYHTGRLWSRLTKNSHSLARIS